jgi:hypothetical protein
MSDQPQDLRRDIERHRAELAETVELLVAKLEIKSRAAATFTELKPKLITYGAAAVGVLTVLIVVRRVRR